MALAEGDVIIDSGTAPLETDPDADLAAGMAVTMTGDGLAPAGDADRAIGVLARGQHGDTSRGVHVGGPVVVARVTDGVTKGSALAGSAATGGTLTGSAGGPFMALSDAGGQLYGQQGTFDLPDGHAAVLIG